MTPLEAEIVHKKLAVIQENLKALGPIHKMNEEEYFQDLYRRKATERLLQELIEAAIDINTHLIVESGFAAPDDYYQSFLKAGEIGVIPPGLALKLAPSAGLRNRLVHEYDHINHAVILAAVGEALELYPQYIQAISNFLVRRRNK
jgi:uncharacterized protein YutE (UPF0331/DUF86 family)